MTCEILSHSGEKKGQQIIVVHNELIDSGVLYRFPFLGDSRYWVHQNRNSFFIFAGPGNTVPHIKRAMVDMNIQDPLTVTRLMPTEEDQWRIIPSTGIACRAPNGQSIELFFDPDNSYALSSLVLWSGRQIAHEINHIARMKMHSLHETLLDALMSEGLGVYYEEHWQNEFAESEWGHVLSEERIGEEWKIARNNLFSKQYSFADWFYGRENGHPMYTGYSLGNAIVSDIMKLNPDLPLSTLTRLSSTELFQMSRFCM